ncbi:MAG: hypothetical protein K9L59_15125 [Desulfobacterales bacterium]|nr:hypothetical protein [Desulfobacterales bacterium]
MILFEVDAHSVFLCKRDEVSVSVIPAKAGIQVLWTPGLRFASPGMTAWEVSPLIKSRSRTGRQSSYETSVEAGIFVGHDVRVVPHRNGTEAVPYIGRTFDKSFTVDQTYRLAVSGGTGFRIFASLVRNDDMTTSKLLMSRCDLIS